MNRERIFDCHLKTHFKKRCKSEVFKELPVFHAERVNFKTDLRQLHLVYDQSGRLGLGDVKPSGLIYRGLA